jgi:hypothetical protein
MRERRDQRNRPQRLANFHHLLPLRRATSVRKVTVGCVRDIRVVP